MDKRLFFLINQAQKRLFRHLDRVSEDELDISVTQVAALMFVASKPGCLQRELAAALDLNKSAITGLIARMESNGLVTRTVPSEDARAVALFATQQGLTKVEGVKPLIAELNHVFEEAFTPEEIRTVLRFLNFIMARF